MDGRQLGGRSRGSVFGGGGVLLVFQKTGMDSWNRSDHRLAIRFPGSDVTDDRRNSGACLRGAGHST